VTDLADAILPLIRTRADVGRWSAAAEHGRHLVVDHPPGETLGDPAGLAAGCAQHHRRAPQDEPTCRALGEPVLFDLCPTTSVTIIEQDEHVLLLLRAHRRVREHHDLSQNGTNAHALDGWHTADACHRIGERLIAQRVVEDLDPPRGRHRLPRAQHAGPGEPGALSLAAHLDIDPLRGGHRQVLRRGDLDQDVLLIDREEVQ